MPLMGVRKKFHHSRQGLAIVPYITEMAFQVARDKYGFDKCELSWVLENNKSMISVAEKTSAKAYKTYRMYEKYL